VDPQNFRLALRLITLSAMKVFSAEYLGGRRSYEAAVHRRGESGTGVK